MRRNAIFFVLLLIVVFVFRTKNSWGSRLTNGLLLKSYQTEKKLDVFVESVHDFSQVYITKDGIKEQLTDGYLNHFQPYGVDDYVVWIEENLDTGVQQVVQYRISTKASRVLQRSDVTINQNPQVNRIGQAVWQGWIQGGWQIFLFDGLNTVQLTTGDIAISPRFKNNQILFLRKDKDGQWRTEKYSVDQELTKSLK